MVRRLALGLVAVVIGTTAAVSPAASVPANAPAPTVTPGIAALTVSWSAAAYEPTTGGRTYEVVLAEETSPGTPLATQSGLTGTSATFSGLNPSVGFVATVTAYDVATAVQVSDPSAATRPSNVGAPTGVRAKASNGSVRLSWTRAAGASEYLVSQDSVPVVRTGRDYATISGLTNGTRYTFRVRSLVPYTLPSPGVASAGSPFVVAVPATVPTAPTLVVGTAGEQQVRLTWRAPTGDGGLPISGYRVAVVGGSPLPSCTSTSVDPCVVIPPGGTPLTRARIVRNLSADRGYSFRAYAVNAMGRSVGSGASTAVQPFTVDPPFSEGMRGPTITDLQRRLNWAGLYLPVTGVFDAATKRQVRHLQEKFLYDQSGVVGSDTWSLLRRITADGPNLPAACEGTSLCVSKTQKILRYIRNGRVVLTTDVRFGASSTPTATGSFSINWKLRENVSEAYGSQMPFTLNFYGGQAVHFSYYFRSDGYWGASHGCINVRSWSDAEYLYENVSIGTRIHIYY